LAYSNQFFLLNKQGDTFSALASIPLLTLVCIGGIGSISGAVFAGSAGLGGEVHVVTSKISGLDNRYTLVSGVGAIRTMMQVRDGVAVDMQNTFHALQRMI
jgi:hypothetical protein